MGGICGICRAGVELTAADVRPMLDALAPPALDLARDTVGGRSAVLGVARRWAFQRTAVLPGIRVAADADLFNGDAGLGAAEAIAHLYQARGMEFAGLIEGTFAVAVWDERAQRLILAIDRLGVKNLYWGQQAGRLFFASRSAAVRAVQEGPAEIRPAALVQYFVGGAVPAPLSIFRGVERLQPGFLLVWENGAIRQHRYWDLEYPENADHSPRYWEREVRQGLRAAVHRHLDGCAQHNTGAYLSGGTDSSSVVAFMRERQETVNTFSICFQESAYDEHAPAQTVARFLGTRHHERCLSPGQALDAVPGIISHYEEPFGNSSAIATHACALLAREDGMETLLAGDGGDELFAGNDRYARDRMFAPYGTLPQWSRTWLVEPMAALLADAHGRLSLPARYIKRARKRNPFRILSYNPFLEAPPEEVFEDGVLEQAPPDTWMDLPQAHFAGAHATSELNRLLYMDLKLTLADNDLLKVTGTAELAGIRVRFPLLDYRLAELSGRIPAGLKLRGQGKRYIFKRAMRGILPDSVLYRKKHGFGVPMGRWLLQERCWNELLQDVLGDARTRQRGYLRPQFLDHLMALHRNQSVDFYGDFLWRVIALELWHRMHVDNLAAASAASSAQMEAR